MGHSPFVHALPFALAVTLPAFGHAATPASYAELDRQSAAACVRAANLRDAAVGPAVRFSDRAGVDVRVVSGVYPQAHMNGARGTALCVYDRRTKRVEAQEPPDGFMAVAAAPPTAPIREVDWIAEDIAGGGIIDNSRVTLRLGSDGRISGRSGCNRYTGGYSLAGSTLRITSPLAGTRMACAPALMNQEGKVLDILGKAASVALTGQGTLVLTASDGRTIRFVRESEDAPPGPIAGAPGFMMLRCGDQQFRVRFDDESAKVAMEDGSQIELMNLNAGGDPGEPRQYTNGRMSFIRTFEGPGRGVKFARGRMAFIPCHIAQN